MSGATTKTGSGRFFEDFRLEGYIADASIKAPIAV